MAKNNNHRKTQNKNRKVKKKPSGKHVKIVKR